MAKATTNKKRKSSSARKLVPAVGMLAVSAAMLSTATYAWFTMNKTVSVTNMQVKAHAEEGLLINEESGATTNWDEEAVANTSATAVQLRPASTADLSIWWHANSKKSSDEAGEGDDNKVDTTNTVTVTGTGDSATYYTNISPNKVSKDETQTASAGSTAARTIYYNTASFSTTDDCDDGEGYYVMYTYYLKSSGTEDLTVPASKLTANVSAELSGASTDLDPALRVGIKIGNDTTIFAPNSGYTSNKVTENAEGSSYTTPVINAGNTDVAINTSEITIADVNDNAGTPVYVYLWFEGEDKACQSDNLGSLINYTITVTFTDTDLG